MLCFESDFISFRHRGLEMPEVAVVVCEISGLNGSNLIFAAFYRPPNMASGYLQNANVLCNVFIPGRF